MTSIDALRRELKSMRQASRNRIIVWVDGEPEPEHTKFDRLIRFPDAIDTYD